MKTQLSATGNPREKFIKSFSDARGLTLIEVILVLTILVIIASFTWPAVSNAFSNQILLKAADKVRTQWGKARIEAMNSGQVVLFRYEMGGSRFRLDRINDVNSFDGNSNATNLSNLDSASDQTVNFNSPYSNYISAKELPSLPEKVVFALGQIENDSRATALAVDPSSQIADAGWSAPIFFYPDGTTSNARLQIGNDRNHMIELSLRGMTGVVKVSEIAVGGTTP